MASSLHWNKHGINLLLQID